MSNQDQTTSAAALPAVSDAFHGGKFAGLTTQKDGTHVAVVLLPGRATDVTWAQAKEWAATAGGELPTRPIAALLYANLKPSLEPSWHWTSEEYEDDASGAWRCDFDDGHQGYGHQSFEGSAVAVRCIPLSS